MVESSTLSRLENLLDEKDYQAACELIAGSVLDSDLEFAEMLRVKLLYSEALCALGQLSQAEELIGNLLYEVELEFGSSSEMLIEPCLEMARIEKCLLQFHEAELLYAEASKLLEENKATPAKRAEVSYQRAELCCKHLADPSRAMMYFKQAISSWKAARRTLSAEYCLAHLQIGLIQSNRGEFELARKEIEVARQCIVENGFDDVILITEVFRHHARICRALRDFAAEERSLEYLVSQLERIKESGKEVDIGVIEARVLLACTQLRNESFVSALKNLKEIVDQLMILGERDQSEQSQEIKQLFEEEQSLRLQEYQELFAQDPAAVEVPQIPGLVVSANRRVESRAEAYAIFSAIGVTLLKLECAESALNVFQQQLSFLTMLENEQRYIFERLEQAFTALERPDDAAWALDRQEEFEEFEEFDGFVANQ